MGLRIVSLSQNVTNGPRRLVLSAGLTGLCSQFLVTSIGEMAGRGMSQQFVGLILLPMIGNAAEVNSMTAKLTFSTWKPLKHR